MYSGCLQMPKFKLRDNEWVVARDKALFHKGAIAFSGVLILTSGRLVWLPDGGIERLAGARPIGVGLERIGSVAVVGLDKMLHVKISSRVLRFSGAGPQRMKDRIDLHRAAASGETLIEEEREVLKERVLFHNEMPIFVKGNLSLRGPVVLTDRRLTIKTQSGFGSMIFSGKSVETLITDIEGVSYSNLENKLHLQIDGQGYILGGGETSKLYLLLQSLEDQSLHDVEGIQCDATYFKGPLGIKGNLLVSPQKLLFCPVSQLDTLIGAQEISIPISEIIAVGLEGWPEQRLWVTTRDEVLRTFLVPDPGSCLAVLGELALRSEREPLFLDRRSDAWDQAAARRALEQAGIHVPEAEIFLMEWGVLAGDEKNLHLGWILLTEDAVRLVQPNFGTRWTLGLSGVGGKVVDEDPGSLTLESEGVFHKLLPVSGRAFVDVFWEMLGEIRPETRLTLTRPNQPIDAVLGAHEKVTMQQRGRTVAELSDVFIQREASGDLRLASQIHQSSLTPDVGASVHIEVAGEGSRYLFKTVILERQLEPEGPTAEVFIRVQKPEEVTGYSLRKHHRMAFLVDLAVSVFASPDPESLDQLRIGHEGALRVSKREPASGAGKATPGRSTNRPQGARRRVDAMVGAHEGDGLAFLGSRRGSLVDVSGGGCGLAFPNSLRDFQVPLERILLMFFLPCEDTVVRVQARPMYEYLAKAPASGTVYGLSFWNLDPAVGRVVQRFLHELERNELKLKARRRGSESGAT